MTDKHGITPYRTVNCSGVERRLLHWNILDGGGSRIGSIIKFLTDGAYDIVTMNELNGYNAASFARLGQRCGLPHTQLLAKSSYHLGVLSRHPIELIASERGHEFAHGLLCVRVIGLTLCVTHLNPHDVTRRAMEAKIIVSRHAQAALDAEQPFMLVGDLNTLSPLDRGAHDDDDLTTKIRTGPYAEALSRKFLTKTRGEVDYNPMQLLLDAPLLDVGAAAGYSVPTAVNADKMHFSKLRLDYCLVSLAVIKATAAAGICRGSATRRSRRHRVRAALLRDELTNTLSDHFPLEVAFQQMPHWTRSGGAGHVYER